MTSFLIHLHFSFYLVLKIIFISLADVTRCKFISRPVTGSTPAFTNRTVGSNGQTDSALSQLVLLLMRRSLPMLSGSTNSFPFVSINGTDQEAVFNNRIRSYVLDMGAWKPV